MRAAVRFFSESNTGPIREKQRIRQWIFKTIAAEGKIAGGINVILCDDEYLTDLNLKYLNHNTLTDILTFPDNESGNRIAGDIFISLPRVKENAAIFRQSAEDELHRVIIHGVLHLLGYRDKTKQEKAVMRNKENEYLSVFSA